jgi:uncharacterized membrane protein
MAPLLAASAYEIVLAVHIMGVVLAFGWAFALPIVFLVAVRHDPRSLPVLHRIEYTVERLLVNPALLLTLAAGIFLASDGHRWGQFFVSWGVAVVVVIGGLVGAVLIPTSKRAEQAIGRDLEVVGTVERGARGEPAAGREPGAAGSFQPGAEYQKLTRRLNIVGSAVGLLALITIAFMVIKP